MSEASLEELGLGKKIIPYTGIHALDWVLNHHMTPLFVMFVATAVFRYMYSAGLIFPLDEPTTTDTTTTTTTAAAAATTATTTTNTKQTNKRNPTKKSTSNTAPPPTGSFVMGISCQVSNNADRLARQQTTIVSIKKVKGVQVVMDAQVSDTTLHAVYVSMDDPKECFEQIRSFLQAKIHVLVDCPLNLLVDDGGNLNNLSTLSQLTALAKKNKVYLMQLAPSRFVASWERMLSSIHAEAGDIHSVQMEYETGPLPRCLEKLWNCFCRCTCCCCGPCVSTSAYKRSRATAAPTLADASVEGLSLLHEVLQDVTSEKKSFVIDANGTKSNATEKELVVNGTYGGNMSTKNNGATTKPIRFRYSCKLFSWKCIFPKALLRVAGSDSTVLHKYYDSINGNQIVQVTSKYGFSHTDRVSDLYDGWTMSIVAFVRAVKFQEQITTILDSNTEALKCLNGVGGVFGAGKKKKNM